MIKRYTNLRFALLYLLCVCLEWMASFIQYTWRLELTPSQSLYRTVLETGNPMLEVEPTSERYQT